MASILKSTLIEFLSCQLNLLNYSVNGPPPYHGWAWTSTVA